MHWILFTIFHHLDVRAWQVPFWSKVYRCTHIGLVVLIESGKDNLNLRLAGLAGSEGLKLDQCVDGPEVLNPQ